MAAACFGAEGGFGPPVVSTCSTGTGTVRCGDPPLVTLWYNDLDTWLNDFYINDFYINDLHTKNVLHTLGAYIPR